MCSSDLLLGCKKNELEDVNAEGSIFDPDTGIEFIRVDFSPTNDCDIVRVKMRVDKEAIPTDEHKRVVGLRLNDIEVHYNFFSPLDMAKEYSRNVRVDCDQPTQFRAYLITTYGGTVRPRLVDNGIRVYEP